MSPKIKTTSGIRSQCEQADFVDVETHWGHCMHGAGKGPTEIQILIHATTRTVCLIACLDKRFANPEQPIRIPTMCYHICVQLTKICNLKIAPHLFYRKNRKNQSVFFNKNSIFKIWKKKIENRAVFLVYQSGFAVFYLKFKFWMKNNKPTSFSGLPLNFFLVFIFSEKLIFFEL
jgi:hypothetical protein